MYLVCVWYLVLLPCFPWCNMIILGADPGFWDVVYVVRVRVRVRVISISARHINPISSIGKNNINNQSLEV